MDSRVLNRAGSGRISDPDGATPPAAPAVCHVLTGLSRPGGGVTTRCGRDTRSGPGEAAGRGAALGGFGLIGSGWDSRHADSGTPPCSISHSGIDRRR